MKSNKNEFLKLLTAYQGIIHKVNRIYFRSEADREDNFQETVYQSGGLSRRCRIKRNLLRGFIRWQSTPPSRK